MTLKECYEVFEGDYEGMFSLLPNEAKMQKFLFMFLEDENYQRLAAALPKKKYEEAFRAVHTLKGVCSNLRITRLYDSASKLTEALRSASYNEAEECMKQVDRDYECTVEAIKSYRQECDV